MPSIRPPEQETPPDQVRPALADKLVLVAVAVLACLVVAVGAFERMPYGYYTLLRVAVCFSAFVLVAAIEPGPWSFLRVALVGCIVLYNPFIPFHLPRSTWFPINMLTIVLLLVSLLPASRPRSSK